MRIDKQILRRMIFKEIKLLKEEKSSEGAANQLENKIRKIVKQYPNSGDISNHLKGEQASALNDLLNMLNGLF